MDMTGVCGGGACFMSSCLARFQCISFHTNTNIWFVPNDAFEGFTVPWNHHTGLRDLGEHGWKHTGVRDSGEHREGANWHSCQYGLWKGWYKAVHLEGMIRPGTINHRKWKQRIFEYLNQRRNKQTKQTLGAVFSRFWRLAMCIKSHLCSVKEKQKETRWSQLKRPLYLECWMSWVSPSPPNLVQKHQGPGRELNVRVFASSSGLLSNIQRCVCVK